MPVKKLIVAASVAGASLLLVAGFASAQGSASDNLVDKIAKRFNVDKDEVQKVFDEERNEQHAQHEKRYEERLNQAVNNGKLTEAQKTKLLAKHKELQAKVKTKHGAMHAEHESMQGKTEAERSKVMEQRKAHMDSLRAEIKNWESENSIPTGYLMAGKGFGSGGHMGLAGRGGGHR